MLKNRKAHFDPVCFVPTIVLIIIGLVVLLFPWGKGGAPMPMLIFFAVMALASPLIHIFHHGPTPIAGVVSIIIAAIAILLLRATIGTGGEIANFYLKNLKLIIIGLIALDIIKTAAP